MKAILCCVAMVCMLFAGGCAEFHSSWLGRPPLYRAPDYYARSDLDELLRFGADLGRRTGSSRAEECRRLLKRQQETPGVGVQLHLMTGRLLSDACGDARKIVDSVRFLPPGSLPDQRVQWLVITQTEALKRLGSTPRRLVTSDRKQKSTQDAPVSKPDSKKDEAKVLREKLEAIRSIEKSLDETNDEN